MESKNELIEIQRLLKKQMLRLDEAVAREIPKKHKYYNIKYQDIDDVYVHGGLTYSDNYLIVNNKKVLNGWFIGWDYAHGGDYLGFETIFDLYKSSLIGKKWTTEEIIKDCTSVIDQLIDKEFNERITNI